MIKLIILDVDGVLTDGRKYYDNDGKVVLKTFCDKDWTAIKRLRAIGINVVFLSGDKNINAQVLKNRKLKAYFNRINNITTPKEDFISEFENVFQCNASEMLYLGDDLFDIGIMRKVGKAYCPADSPRAVKDVATELPAKGGENVIMVLFDVLESKGVIPNVSFEEVMPKIVKLDEEEKF